MSGYPASVQNAIDKLKSFYNGGSWGPTNPGGMDNGGHRVNFIGALNNVADVGIGVADMAQSVGQSATAAAVSQTTANQSALQAVASAASAAQAATTAEAARTQVQQALASIQNGPVASWNGQTGSVQADSRHLPAASRTLSTNDSCVPGEYLTLTTPLTLTLPANPANGSLVSVYNACPIANGYPVLARNGALLCGKAEDMTINLTGVWVGLRYVDATNGWALV
ncbi:hypothetical protein [Parachitinimonas caeni]|uniref:Uncharacterized protein n=1 Tax=Parachitinimonas caeni TaxID=3031301 RepID=A0ABT7DVC8_9NEIS|nr:hypothetical protein [Parachitinimonas caeni]MDK2122607.1 hypothetical protein [Parachitinimonas caeni]